MQHSLDVNGRHGADPYRWIVLGAATFSQASAAFVTQGLAVLAGFIQTGLQLSAFQVGLLFTASTLMPLFTLLFVGNLLDYRSERSIICGGSLLMGGGLALAWGASGFVSLLLALLLIGAGYSTIQPGGSRSVSGWFAEGELGLAMGVRQAGLPLGGALAGMFIPLAIHDGNWRAAFVLCLIVVTFGGCAFYRLYRRPRFAPGRSVRQALSIALVRGLVAQAWLQRLTVLGVVMVAIQYGVVVNLMLYLRDVQHIPLARGAGMLALSQLCGGMGRIGLAALGDRLAGSGGRHVPLNLCFGAAALGLVCLLLLPAGTSMSVLFVLSAWLGFFAMGWYGPWVACIAHAAPKEMLGLTLGVAMALNQLAIVVTPPLLGKLHDLTRHYWPVWLVLLAAQCVAWAGIRRLAGTARDAGRAGAGALE